MEAASIDGRPTPATLESEGGYQGTGEGVERIPLFHCQYLDHFGNDTFQVLCSLSSHHSDDWSDFILTPDLTGGGNVGASTEVTTHFDRKNMKLMISIYQGFNVTKQAKRCQLAFVLEGRPIRSARW